MAVEARAVFVQGTLGIGGSMGSGCWCPGREPWSAGLQIGTHLSGFIASEGVKQFSQPPASDPTGRAENVVHGRRWQLQGERVLSSSRPLKANICRAPAEP